MQINKNALVVIGLSLLLVGVVFGTIIRLSIIPSTGFIYMSQGSPYESEKPCSYLIGKVGSYYYMINGTTSIIDAYDTIFQNIWNWAVTNTSNIGGGTVFLTAGIYDMASYATYDALDLQNNVKVEGEDMYSVIINVPSDLGGYEAAIKVGDGTNYIANVTLSEFTVDVNSSSGDTNYGEMGVWIRYGENIVCERMFIQNACGWGIRAASGSTTKNTKNVLVDKCKIINCRYDCVQFMGWDTDHRNCWETEVTNSYFAHAEGGVVHYNAEKGLINNNVFVDLGGWGGTAGHAIVPHGTTTTGGSNDILIDGNIIVDDSPVGIYNGISIYYDSYNIEITNNLINLSVNRGINLQLNGRNHIVRENMIHRGNTSTQTNTFAIYGKATHSTIEDNTFTGDYDGDYFIYMWTASGQPMNGYNTFKNNYFYKIPKAMWLLRSSGNTISGNYFFDDGTVTTKGIVINTATPDPDYNRIIDNDFIGLKKAGAICITLGNDPLETNILDNRFRNCTTGISIATGTNTKIYRNSFLNVTTPISDSGTNTLIKWNDGYVTENSGTQTVANGENIAHGLVDTPVYYDVTCLNETYDSEPIMAWLNYTGIDSTNLQVLVYWFNGTAITDDTILVAWDARTWN